MIVVVAEKPSVGRDLARVLKCTQRGEGFLRGENHTVTWAIGHLVTLCEPDELDEKYKKWRMEDLPILPEKIPTKVISKTKSQFSVIKKLINDPETERLICATDAGREGELIFRLIYQQAKCKKPVDRLWISSMTDEAIREGFASLKPGGEYDGLYRSATCRSQADWLVGMNASRAFTLRFDALLSIGRVQTPTLAILVKRYHEIADFKPEEYYTVTANFGDYTGQWFDEKAEDEKKASRIPNKEAADRIAKAIRGKAARVKAVTAEAKKELPPQLYDLTSLQREANRKLGYTADKTLKIAQELYEKWKAITYPRTDSRYLPMDMLGRAKQTLQKLPEAYHGFVQNIPWGEGGKLPFSKRIFDNAKVSDHHAIIPTSQTAPLDKLPAEAAKLFDMIARRAIAVFYPAHEYDAIKVVTICEGHAFKSSGKVVRVKGWKDVYPTDEQEEGALPNLREGDGRLAEKASVKKESTKPPAPHTDASLLAAMENAGRELEDEKLREQMKGSGLGTPATRAAIIERLIQVGYAARKGRALNATEKGVSLIAIAPPEIASPETTGKWELALDEIAKNKRDTERFMQGIRNLTTFLISYARDTKTDASFPEEMRRKGKGSRKSPNAKSVPGAKCPLCGKAVQENAKAFGCSAWREGCRFTLWKDCLTKGGGPMLTEKLVALLLEKSTVKGSTGIVSLRDGQISFTPNGRETPSIFTGITYEKK
ncbi:MAG: DNA topoisomerase III [Clostridiales bacterium]|nr:DNA topoisomerase III [Clostridiales bacterium]